MMWEIRFKIFSQVLNFPRKLMNCSRWTLYELLKHHLTFLHINRSSGRSKKCLCHFQGGGKSFCCLLQSKHLMVLKPSLHNQTRQLSKEKKIFPRWFYFRFASRNTKKTRGSPSHKQHGGPRGSLVFWAPSNTHRSQPPPGLCFYSIPVLNDWLLAFSACGDFTLLLEPCPLSQRRALWRTRCLSVPCQLPHTHTAV